MTNIQTISFISQTLVALVYWVHQPDSDPSRYPNITTASGHRSDLITYYRYLSAVYMGQVVRWRENTANCGISLRIPLLLAGYDAGGDAARATAMRYLPGWARVGPPDVVPHTARIRRANAITAARRHRGTRRSRHTGDER